MLIIIGVLVILAILVLSAAAASVYGYLTKSPKVGVHDKTFWDWLSILIVPVLLTLGGIVFAAYQDIRQQAIEDQRAKNEQQIEDQRAQDAALQAYLDQMTQLLLKEDLRNSQQEDATSALARARTLTVLRRLDGAGRGSVVQFLYESELLAQFQGPQQPPSPEEREKLEQEIKNYLKFQQYEVEVEELQKNTGVEWFAECNLGGPEQFADPDTQFPSPEDKAKTNDLNKKLAELRERYWPESGQPQVSPPLLPGSARIEPVINLGGANLAGAQLQGVWLRGAALEEVDLHDANLAGSDLDGATLYRTDLHGANLEGGRLIGARMDDARLSSAHLRRADLRAVQLGQGDLSRANLHQAYLFSGNLQFATLRDANLRQAVLIDADLSCANLSNANLSDADLSTIGPAGYEVPEIQNSNAQPGAETPVLPGEDGPGAQDNLNLPAVDLSKTAADLSGADLSGADLSGADLSGVDLENASVTEEQLAKCESLEGATMPNGQKYEEWRKDKEGRGEDGGERGPS